MWQAWSRLPKQNAVLKRQSCQGHIEAALALDYRRMVGYPSHSYRTDATVSPCDGCRHLRSRRLHSQGSRLDDTGVMWLVALFQLRAFASDLEMPMAVEDYHSLVPVNAIGSAGQSIPELNRHVRDRHRLSGGMYYHAE